MWIQPAAGDAGGALGAAQAANHMYFDQPRAVNPLDDMSGSYLGPEYSEKEVLLMTRKYKATYKKFDAFEDLAKRSAKIIDEGKIIGWFQGRMEFGPRALGNRSIVGDARNAEMQKTLNLKIKFRESFRPFAPSVLAEDCTNYFDFASSSPYMLVVDKVRKDRWKPLPENYDSLDIKEKLYHLRSDIPAITHIDFTGRIQTVHKETNLKYWTLINEFKQHTGYGLIVNTSFNVRGEPIVCTPEDAYRCFMRTNMDYLVVDNFMFEKTAQPTWDQTDNWKEEFKLD